MKRLSVVIFVFLICMTLSAAKTVGSSSTQVCVNLTLNPTYDFNVTTKKVSETDRVVDNVVDDSTGIILAYDKDDLTLIGSTSDYYISYIFTEYRTCSLSVALDGNLTLDGKEEAKENESVPFEAEIEVSDTEKVTLYSKDKSSATIVRVGEEATRIAQKVYGSFGLSINPSSAAGEERIESKEFGYYSANIVFTVTEA